MTVMAPATEWTKNVHNMPIEYKASPIVQKLRGVAMLSTRRTARPNVDERDSRRSTNCLRPSVEIHGSTAPDANATMA